MDMPQPAKPTVVYHADWGSKEEKRWCAKATLGADGHYTAFAPKLVDKLGSLIGQLRTEAGETGCALAGFDFPIGVPESYAKRARIATPRRVLPLSSSNVSAGTLSRTAHRARTLPSASYRVRCDPSAKTTTEARDLPLAS